MDFSKFTIEEKNNICHYWIDLNYSIKNQAEFIPCQVAYNSNFDMDVMKQNGLGNSVYDNYYEAYVGDEFFDTFYNALVTNSWGYSQEKIDNMLKAPVLQKKIQKLQEQEQVNTLFNDTSLKLETVPVTLTSAIGIAMAVVILFIAIKKGLKYIIESIKYGKKKHMN